VSNDEQSDSLAAQAAAWVPPWERPQREPDRAFQEAAERAAREDRGADESAVVDAPADDSEQGPTDVRVGPELPVPEAVADAADDDGDGEAVDEPLPADGDDAGDVFDAAADDDVSDDDEVDIPVDEDAVTSDDDAGDADDDAGADAEPVAAVVLPGQASRARDFDGAVGDPASRTSDEAVEADAGADLPGLEDEAELAAALEAILLVVDEPVGEMQLAEILEQPTERVAASLDDISARYTAAGHGFDLRKVAGGWRLYTRPEYAAYVERFVLDGQSVRLTQAALETLAVVAYKQPVTRSRISAIRGVNCDGVMRTLATRGLIEECGTEGETGAYLYRTTPLFLEKLGLNSIDQLPPLAPFLPDDVEEVLDASG
jgi:segregation and condensation protein B